MVYLLLNALSETFSFLLFLLTSLFERKRMGTVFFNKFNPSNFLSIRFRLFIKDEKI